MKTLWLREEDRDMLNGMIRDHLAQGRQAYVVYPLVQESAARDMTPPPVAPLRAATRRRFPHDRASGPTTGGGVKAATQMARRLQTERFPDVVVGLLHGQMKPADKERTMRAFLDGKIQLLVSTVIVEVGLDVPNATLMVIEHPERFGLAQLHQLRGRIGRSSHPAICAVISNGTEETARERLEAFVRIADGFELAEKDLEIRGPGELLGRRQHGWLRFRIANLLRDRRLLEIAREEAGILVAHDPQLRDPALEALRDQLARFRQHPG